MYSSPRVQRVLELSKKYADIAVQIHKLQQLNKPVGRLVGERIATYSKLVTHLEILESICREKEARTSDQLNAHAIGVNFEECKK